MGIGPGLRVVDVGCGYGATSRVLARDYGAELTGLTLSASQAAAFPRAERVQLLVRDWLENGLPDAAFDAAVSIEALSHMPDKPRAFAELGRVVKPGARVVLVDWLTRERPSAREVRWLLRPICEEGHLPSLHAPSEYDALLRESGFAVESYEDLSARAARTWAVVARRLPGVLARDPLLTARLLRSPDRVFALSLARIPLAYRVGAMRLGMFTAVKGAA